jgi:hypothetical protein
LFLSEKGSVIFNNITERTADSNLLIAYNSGTLRALKDNIKRRRILYAFHRPQDHGAKIYIQDVNSIIFIVTLRSKKKKKERKKEKEKERVRDRESDLIFKATVKLTPCE